MDDELQNQFDDLWQKKFGSHPLDNTPPIQQEQQPQDDTLKQFDTVANQSLPYRKLADPEKYNTQAYKAADKLTDYPYNKVLSMASAGGVPADQREEFLQAIHEYAGHKKTSQQMGAPKAMAVGMFNQAVGLGEFFAEKTGLAQEPEDMRKFEKHVDAAWSKADPLTNPDAPWYSPRKIGVSVAEAAPQMEAAIGAGPMLAFGAPAAGKTYDDLMEKGVAPNTAKAAAAFSGVVTGAIFSGLPEKMLPKGMTQEALGSELAENFVARYAKTALIRGPGTMAGAQAANEAIQDFAQGKTPDVQRIAANAAQTWMQSIPTMAVLALPGAAIEGISKIGRPAEAPPPPELTDTQQAVIKAADSGVKPSRTQAKDWNLQIEGENNIKNRTAALQKAAEEHKAQTAQAVPTQPKAPQETTTVPSEKAEDISKSLNVHKDLTDTIKSQALKLKPPTGDKTEVLYPAEGDKPEVKGEYLGDVNGKRVMAVNAIDVNRSLVDKKGAEDFISGGNPPWWKELFKNDKGPKENELWVADYVPPEELPKWAAHEALEEHLMSNKGMKYDDAHPEANKMEWGWAEKGEGDVRSAPPPVNEEEFIKDFKENSRPAVKMADGKIFEAEVKGNHGKALQKAKEAGYDEKAYVNAKYGWTYKGQFLDENVLGKEEGGYENLTSENVQGVSGTPGGKFPRAITEMAKKKGFMKSEEAAVPIEPVVEKLTEVRNKVGNALRMADPTKALSIAKDYSENLPVIEAEKYANEVNHELARSMGRKNLKSKPWDRMALSFAREANGSREKMQEFVNKIDATQGNRIAKEAVHIAQDNQEALDSAQDRMLHFLEDRLMSEQEKGFDVKDMGPNYLPHEQEVKPELALLFPEKGYGGKSFAHQRVYESLADSIAAGIKPKTLDAIDLFKARMRKGIRMETQKEFAEAGRSITDPTTKMPLITDLQVKYKDDPEGRVVAPKGYVKKIVNGVKMAVLNGYDEKKTYSHFTDADKHTIDPTTKQPVLKDLEKKQIISDKVAPSGYVVKNIGGNQVAVHQGYASLYDALTGGSDIRNSTLGRVAMTGVGGIKHGLLLFDTYHLGRLAFWTSSLHPTATIMGEARYKRGLSLLDNTDTELQRMARDGDIPKEYIDGLMEKRRKLDLGIKNGLNVGRISDNIAPNFLKTMPIIKQTAGAYNTWLFEQYQRGAITTAYDIEFDRVKGMLPELNDNQIAQRVSGDLNTRFGNLGSQGWIKSNTLKDVLRLTFLAPQWNEGLIKSEYNAVKGLGETARYAASGRLVSNAITKSVVTGIAGTFLANQILNYITRGKPTWENEEEGFGSKISAYIPNPFGKGGVFLNPLALPAEITHQVIARLEKDGTLLQAAADVVGYKAGPIPRSMHAALDAVQKGGSDWEAIKAAGSGLLPLPIPAKAVAAAGKSIAGGKVAEDYPGQIEKQLMASAGIKTDMAPLPENRIYALADKFRNSYTSKTGVKLPPKPPSEAGDYAELTHALRQGDTNRADKAMKELVKIKETPAIYKHYRQYPFETFTDSKKLEYQFKQTLNKEQLGAYDKAKAGRMEIANKFRDVFTPEKINKLRE
jgi:fructose-specific phosphotransferase system component IIB